jgi:hypothetical protein
MLLRTVQECRLVAAGVVFYSTPMHSWWVRLAVHALLKDEEVSRFVLSTGDRCAIRVTATGVKLQVTGYVTGWLTGIVATQQQLVY